MKNLKIMNMTKYCYLIDVILKSLVTTSLLRYNKNVGISLENFSLLNLDEQTSHAK